MWVGVYCPRNAREGVKGSSIPGALLSFSSRFHIRSVHWWIYTEYIIHLKILDTTTKHPTYKIKQGLDPNVRCSKRACQIMFLGWVGEPTNCGMSGWVGWSVKCGVSGWVGGPVKCGVSAWARGTVKLCY